MVDSPELNNALAEKLAAIGAGANSVIDLQGTSSITIILLSDRYLILVY